MQEPRVAGELRALREAGWQIGLHQSFDAWQNAEIMRGEKDLLEKALGGKVTSCRQHWLRFSWEYTWKAQEAAGLELDATLGFNDRPGFRNGAAIRFHPLDPASGQRLKLLAVPTILMDSQLYDYSDYDEMERCRQIKRWVEEVRMVRGSAAFLWHQQSFSRDYGWQAGYEKLLELAAQA